MKFLFNSSPLSDKCAILPPNWNYVAKGLSANIERCTKYYQEQTVAAKGGHFLVRLLGSIGVPMKNHIERYHALVETKTMSLAQTMRATSSVSKGSLFKGIFYGENSQEVIVFIDDYFDPYIAEVNWESLKPIRCVLHPISDINYCIPDGTSSSTDSGLSVFEINVPMLAVQFRSFVLSNAKNFIDKDTALLSTNHFIHKYVLSSMIESQVNMCLFNRIYNLVLGVPMGDTRRNLPFYVTDYTDGIDKVFKEQIEYFKRHANNYKTIMLTFQSASGTLFDTLQLPNTATTRQIVWVDVISRLRAMEMLVTLARASGRGIDESVINEYKRNLRYYSSDRSLQHALYPEIRDDLDRIIYKIMNDSFWRHIGEVLSSPIYAVFSTYLRSSVWSSYCWCRNPMSPWSGRTS